MAVQLLRGHLVTVKGTGEDGSNYPVHGDVCYIGRGLGCNIRLRNDELNDRHCVIKISDLGKVTIYSSDSENPVLLNDEEVSGDGRSVEPGDLIRILNYTFRWEKAEAQNEDLVKCRSSLAIEKTETVEEVLVQRFSAPPCLLTDDSKENQENSQEERSDDYVEDKLENGVEEEKFEDCLEDISDLETPDNMLHTDPVDPSMDTTSLEDKVQDSQSILHSPKCFDKAYHSTPKCTPIKSNPKERSSNPSVVSLSNLAENSADMSQSPSKLRGRRSTGIVPFVGTPSDVYRTTRGILTPANKTRLERTSLEVKVSLGPRDSLSTVMKSAKQFRQRSSERKSTPLKPRMSDKSIARESILHSPIIEDYSREKCEESQNESGGNSDSKYRFVAARHRRPFGGSSFAIENRIAEESETGGSEIASDENDVEEEDSLIASSYCDKFIENSFDQSCEKPMSARIVVNGNTCDSDELNSTFTIDVNETEKEDSPAKNSIAPKSILTPLPNSSAMREKSAKKVTFARHVIDEFDESSPEATTLKDSYEMSSRQSLTSVDVSDIDLTNKGCNSEESFCRNEEMYAADKTPSDLCSEDAPGSPGAKACSTPVGYVNVEGVKRIFKTPCGAYANYNNVEGVKRLMRTPGTPACSYENVDGVMELLQTPKTPAKSEVQCIPETSCDTLVNDENVEGIEPLMKTPSSPACSYENVDGVRELLKTPKTPAISEHAEGVECAIETSVVPQIIVTDATLVESSEMGVESETAGASADIAPSTDEVESEPEEAFEIAPSTPTSNETEEASSKTPPSAPADACIEQVSGTPLPQLTAKDSELSEAEMEPMELPVIPETVSSDAALIEPSVTAIESETAEETPADVAPSAEVAAEIVDEASAIAQNADEVENEKAEEASEIALASPTKSSLSPETPATQSRIANGKMFESTSRSETVSFVEPASYSMKISTRIESNESSTTLPYTSTPHPKTGRVLNSTILSDSRALQNSKLLERMNFEETDPEQYNPPVASSVESSAVKSTDVTVPIAEDPEAESNNIVIESNDVPRTPLANYENVEGMKRMFKTPRNTPCADYRNVEGVKRLLKTPGGPISSYDDVEGVRELLKTPKASVLEVDEDNTDASILRADVTEKVSQLNDTVDTAVPVESVASSTFNVEHSEVFDSADSSKKIQLDTDSNELTQDSMTDTKAPICSTAIEETIEECSATAIEECSATTSIPVSTSTISDAVTQTSTSLLENSIWGSQDEDTTEQLSLAVTEIHDTVAESSSVSKTPVGESELEEPGQSAEAIPQDSKIEEPEQTSEAIPQDTTSATVTPEEVTEVEKASEVEPASEIEPAALVSAESAVAVEPAPVGIPEAEDVQLSVVPPESVVQLVETEDFQGAEATENDPASKIPDPDAPIEAVSKDMCHVPVSSEIVESDAIVTKTGAESEIKAGDEKTRTLLDSCEVLLTRTDTDPPRRSGRVSKRPSRLAREETDVTKAKKVDEKSTPVGGDEDLEKSAKRTRKDRGNEENDARFSIDQNTEAVRHEEGDQSQKRTDEKPQLVNPTLLITKIDLPENMEQPESTTAKTSLRKDKVKHFAKLKNIENVYTGSHRNNRASEKLVETTASSPPKFVRCSIDDLTSPFSIRIPVLDDHAVNDGEVNDENVNVTRPKGSRKTSDPSECTNVELAAKGKRPTKKPAAKHVTFPGERSQDSAGETAVVHDIAKRSTRGKKVPPEKEAASIKPTKEKSEAVIIDKPAATARATRNRRGLPEQPATKSPKRAATRKGRDAPSDDETKPPETKKKRTVRGGQEKEDLEVASLEPEPKARRTLRGSRERLDEAKAASPEPKRKRALRGEKASDGVDQKVEAPTRAKRAVRDSREKADEPLDKKTARPASRSKSALRGSREQPDEAAIESVKVERKTLKAKKGKAEATANVTARVAEVEAPTATRSRRGAKTNDEHPADEPAAGNARATRNRKNTATSVEEKPKKSTSQQFVVSKTSVKVTRTKTVVKRRLSTINESSDSETAEKRVRKVSFVTRRKSVTLKSSKAKSGATKPVRKTAAEEVASASSRPTRAAGKSAKVEKVVSPVTKRTASTRSATSAKEPAAKKIKSVAPTNASPVSRVTRNKTKATTSTTRSGARRQ